MNHDYNLQRFIDAQQNDYPVALEEIKSGRKRSHWMWYIFPQIQGLGLSYTSKFYALADLNEAAAVFKHPLLGPRLMTISNELMKLETNDANAIFGKPDDRKLQSSMTLFSLVPGAYPVFEQVLD